MRPAAAVLSVTKYAFSLHHPRRSLRRTRARVIAVRLDAGAIGAKLTAQKKRTSSQTALCLAVFWKRLPRISFSIICLGSAENDRRAADGILPQL